ncbi:hypothetical protein [Candidatus Marithrix sp. Canyon 246]|uniref:hypothetical protein n=1 Tax=Candidatus Marithrix sp. Canyon 246 TaxID=1827136 RepID=UPI0014960F03|nr:hypothetical protein [Candidatus Marithrix sp. Canyon 246]
MDGSQGLINFELRKKLPFISITAVHRGIEFQIDHVLVDTGSAATIFASDYLRKFGIDSEPEDKVRKIGGDLLMRTKMIIDYEKCTILLQHSS